MDNITKEHAFKTDESRIVTSPIRNKFKNFQSGFLKKIEKNSTC